MLALFIVIYLLLTLGIGFWASKKIKTSGDFTLAGKSLSSAFVGVTLFATWFGSGQIMGNPSYIIEHGISSFIPLILSSGITLFIVGKYFTPKLYAMNIVTVADFFRIRYNKNLELTSSILTVFSYPHWIAAQFLALAYLFNVIFGIPVNYGIILGASLVIFYTYIGGMWAVSYTDMVQSIMILFGLLFLLYEVLSQTGGIEPLFEGKSPEFMSLLPQEGVKSYSDYIALFIAFCFGSMVVQEVYQRVFSARDVKAAQNGLYLGGILLVVIPVIPVLIALGGMKLHPELLNLNDSQEVIPSMVSRFTSIPVQILFYGAMISAILSTSSGAMLAPATVISENLIKPYYTHFSDRKMLRFTRLGVVVVAVVSCYFAYDDSDIVGLVEASLSLILVCLFAPFTFGLFWSKASIRGAWCSVILGATSWFICFLFDSLIAPTIIGTSISLLAMVLGSLLLPDNN